jgi:predicted DNA-binding protein YlxM (UPF0122 family)
MSDYSAVSIEEVREKIRQAEILLEQCEAKLQLARSQGRTDDLTKLQQMYNQLLSDTKKYKEYLRYREGLL